MKPCGRDRFSDENLGYGHKNFENHCRRLLLDIIDSDMRLLFCSFYVYAYFLYAFIYLSILFLKQFKMENH